MLIKKRISVVEIVVVDIVVVVVDDDGVIWHPNGVNAHTICLDQYFC